MITDKEAFDAWRKLHSQWENLSESVIWLAACEYKDAKIKDLMMDMAVNQFKAGVEYGKSLKEQS